MSTSPDPAVPLAYALATWVFLLHVDGVHADDAGLHEACEAVHSASDETTGNAAGERLVDRVRALLAGEGPTEVQAFASSLYGDRALFDLGEGDRGARTHRIRQYQFSRSLPWLARIWERQADGAVAPTWMVIERVTDQVHAMDPNPW
ncbi:MAG: hypothetical protein KC656_28145, partial [Myxococcales bacterium]|nr:hypothetical protein [Myxococcales bacterium]